MLMDPTPSGTVVFSTVGRTAYGFDVFSLPLSTTATNPELRLTDTLSINFNAQFVHGRGDNVIVFVSERTGSPRIFLSHPGLPSPQPLPSVPESRFHDRPVISNSTLYFISAHQPPRRHFTSWSALYSTDINSKDQAKRLTPLGSVDFSPAVSLSGRFVAVASYGDRPWAGEFHQLNTDIVVFDASDPDNRVVACHRGGWPSWCGDSTIYFHGQAEDGWWSIFRLHFNGLSETPISPERITPPGVHCFTPAAQHDGKSVAVATRRRGSKFRHIELFDLESKTFRQLTEKINPELHHYNPFVSSDSKFVGYHRFRGRSTGGTKAVIPNLDPVESPVRSLRMLRINGSFPSFSPNGDLIAFNHELAGENAGLKIMKSDGSKRWSLIKDRTIFYNAWSPSPETTTHAIYASIGPIFESVKATVQIARITFDAVDLGGDGDEVPCEVKILTREETGNNAFPSVSPDGKSIVFRSGRSGHKNLYIIDAVNGEFDGGSIRRLTDGAWIDTMPAWSPKGDLIAFSSNRHKADDDRVFSAYVIRPDGTGLRRIHVADDVDRERINHVCFSKDQEWLVFTSNLGGVTAEPVSLPNQFQPYGDLYAVRLDGSELTRLTWNGYENGTPAWHSGSDDVELGGLRLGSYDEDGEELLGRFEEPLWITFDF